MVWFSTLAIERNRKDGAPGRGLQIITLSRRTIEAVAKARPK
jgi:hypothetical protein